MACVVKCYLEHKAEVKPHLNQELTSSSKVVYKTLETINENFGLATTEEIKPIGITKPFRTFWEECKWKERDENYGISPTGKFFRIVIEKTLKCAKGGLNADVSLSLTNQLTLLLLKAMLYVGSRGRLE